MEVSKADEDGVAGVCDGVDAGQGGMSDATGLVKIATGPGADFAAGCRPGRVIRPDRDTPRRWSPPRVP